MQKNLFEQTFTALEATNVETLGIRIRLDGRWCAEDWKFRSMRNIIDTKDFSPMKCFFYYFLDTSPELFITETLERLPKVKRLRIRVGSCVDPEGKSVWSDPPLVESVWNLDENIEGRGLPHNPLAAGRPVEFEKFSEDNMVYIGDTYVDLSSLHRF